MGVQSGDKNTWRYFEDFDGAGTFGTSASEGDDWVITDTSGGGTPTYTRLDHGEGSAVNAPGVAALAFDTAAEPQNVCLSFGDKLCWDFDSLQHAEGRVRLAPAGTLKDETTTLAWGIAGDRNDTIDTIAVASLFRLASGSAVNTVVAETDDGTNNNDDVATGISLADDTWHRWEMDFSVKTAVKFFLANSSDILKRVSQATTFDMSNHTGAVQPFYQIQKTSDNNADAVHIDYLLVEGTR